MELPYVTLMLRPSARQSADLTQLLETQQDASSPNYHGWLTPEQYADRFGVSQGDISKIVAWLGQHQLSVKSVARGRNAIVLSGGAGAVGAAFGVEIHHYLVGGEVHYANAADPTIPAALDGMVLAIRGLHDFRLKPRLRRMVRPRDTLSDGEHQLGPGDIATIYDITPVYNAGITGTGYTLAIAGQTDIEMADIEKFRSQFGLPANDPTVMLVPGSKDPGVQSSSGDLGEADLDLELSGAVAKNAEILFVNSGDVVTSLQYAIDQRLAPVLSTSYGDCELDTGSAEAQALATLAAQANAQGQTIFAASGDDGAADCFGIGDGPAIDNALSVDLPAALPQVTGVGGTEFSEGGGNYWNSRNSSALESALSYIPEITWNDSAADGTPSASGGGVSVYFPKPSWQVAPGVPSDGYRDVPDVALAASPDHDGYLIVSGGSTQVIGGTSAGPPQFSAMTLLLGQYLVANGFQSSAYLGNINPTLYELATVSGVFHDITSGNNKVVACTQPCVGTAIGYDAGVGYDQVTGLGSVDAYNFVTAWHSASAGGGKSSVTVTLGASAAALTFSGTTVLTATVASASGAPPSGTVTFSVGTDSLGTATLSGQGSSAKAALTIGGFLLAAGVNSISAQYNGDNAYEGGTAAASVTISSTPTGPPTLKSTVNGASFSTSLAPGGVLSIFGTDLASFTAGAPSVPLPMMMAGTVVTINGITAPLYYVSASQLNVQIPFEVPAGAAASLRVSNNGESVFGSINVTAAAPAIFSTNSQGTGQGAILNTSYELVDASHPATPGSTYIQIYCINLGAVSNEPADGAASPFNPLAQAANPKVTIGGVAATVSFAGLAPGFVGEYQVNALVPAGLAANSATPVVISAGTVTSNTVTIAVGP